MTVLIARLDDLLCCSVRLPLSFSSNPPTELDLGERTLRLPTPPVGIRVTVLSDLPATATPVHVHRKEVLLSYGRKDASTSGYIIAIHYNEQFDLELLRAYTADVYEAIEALNIQAMPWVGSDLCGVDPETYYLLKI